MSNRLFIRQKAWSGTGVLGLCLVLAGCGTECDSLDNCPREDCQIVEGTRLGDEGEAVGSGPAGCSDQGRVASDVVTYARDESEACWMFPSSLIPIGFVEDSACAPSAN